MTEPLSKLLSSIPVARRRAINKLVSDSIRRGEVNTTEDAMIELDKLTSEILQSNVESIMKVRKAVTGKRISSQDWNDTQREIFVDLNAVYTEMQGVGALSNKHSEINQSELRQSKAAINKAINDIRLYQFLREFPEYQDAKYVDFSDGRNLDTRRPLAMIDTQTRKLELGAKFRDRIQQQNLDLRSTKVEVTLLGGGTSGGFDESFTPELMLDDNPDTFWADLVMTDGLITQTYVPSSDAGLGTNFISNGLLAEVEIKFSRTEKINNISFLPFGQFPIKVIDLAYKESPHANTWITVPNFTVSDASLDWYEWSFSPIHVSNVRITLEQVNFTTNIFHIPENLVHNQSLWSQIQNQKVDKSIHEIEITEQVEGTIAAEPEKLAYLNAVKQVDEELRLLSLTLTKSSDQYKITSELMRASGKVLARINPTALNDVLIPIGADKEIIGENPTIIQIKKHEFIVGVRSIELSNILYQPLGHYSSPKFVSGATILEISTETTETHPSFNDGLSNFNRTSVEYTIEIGDNTRFPIVPANYETITGAGSEKSYKIPDEYVAIDRVTQIGYTRLHPGSLVVIVRKNGRRAQFSDYSFIIDGSREQGKLTILQNFDANGVYTISYVALEAAAIIDINAKFNSTDLIDPEVFTSTTRNNALKLNYFPYIEYEIVNETGKWIKDDDEDAKWRFNPTRENYKGGDVSIASGSIIVTGNVTDFTGNMDTSAGITNVFRVKGQQTVFKIESVPDSGRLILEIPYDSTGIISGAYQLGQSFEADGRTYALDSIIYEPLTVFINDIKAFNLTSYRNLEHPAFIPGDKFGRQYQFIHAGQILYFNKPVEGARIEVRYGWLTQYIQLKATLRSNIPVRTNITPKVNNMTVRIKNSKL